MKILDLFTFRDQNGKPDFVMIGLAGLSVACTGIILFSWLQLHL